MADGACIGKHADAVGIAHGQAVPPGHYGQGHSVRRTESMGNRERKGGKMQVDGCNNYRRMVIFPIEAKIWV